VTDLILPKLSLGALGTGSAPRSQRAGCIARAGWGWCCTARRGDGNLPAEV